MPGPENHCVALARGLPRAHVLIVLPSLWEASTGGITQAARRVRVETMQVGIMEEARQHVAEAASVLGWDRAEAATMGVKPVTY